MILSISEDLTEEHAPVLRAGIQKIYGAGKNIIVLDLTNAKQELTATLKKIVASISANIDVEIDLTIIHPDTSVGTAQSRESAVQKLSNPIERILALEARQKAKISRLEKRKAALSEKLSAQGDDKDIKTTLKENAELKQKLGIMEKHLEVLLERRKKPKKPDEILKEYEDDLNKILMLVLQQEGVLSEEAGKK